MKQTITVNYRNYDDSAEIDLPNTCPHCGEIMKPHFLYGDSTENANDSSKMIGILLQCTHEKCLNYFAERYYYGSESNFKFRRLPNSYTPPIKIDLPENIEKISSGFIEIYSQSTKAETEKLDQIAGVGYRKSLEFLIKDYAIRKHPNETENIKSKMLGPVISEYLTDFPKLQNLAKAATWIGNDETHYVRRHTDKDIRDMKAFIRSASQFIAADYDADVAEEFINE
ncbi:DUF4145 domain-containing protein [Enterococcus malodoratus]|uniref:DUF4145 domain-containing protein n=1 Tax=Enterococcus malodoratus TaxID=71451 RepID=UPI0022E7C5CF|nr:DUF4145 domain-containing protein [Enterococcus malodoratus]